MQNQLPIFRAMAEHMQYSELCLKGEDYLAQTKDVRILPLLTLAYVHEQDQEQAEYFHKKTLDYSSNYDLDSQTDMAAALIAMRHLEQAQNTLENIIQQAPQHTVAKARLAHCLLQQGEWVRSQQLFEQALSENSKRISVYIGLSQSLVQQQNYTAATNAINQTRQRIDQQTNTLPKETVTSYRRICDSIIIHIWAATEQYESVEEYLALKQSELNEEDFVELMIEYSTRLSEYDHHVAAQETIRRYLKLFNKNSKLRLRLSELALIQGFFVQAALITEKAIQLDKDNIELWVQLAHTHIHRHNQDARKAAEKAVELATKLVKNNPKADAKDRFQLASAKTTLAQVEASSGFLDIAESLFKEVLESNPGFTQAHQGLGNLKMQQGKIDEAVSYFDNVKHADPLSAYAGLISARQFPEDEETLLKLEKAAQLPSLEGSVKSSILFHLAAAWHKLKDYKHAFELVDTANKASKRYLSYDAKDHRQYCARIRYAFSKSLYQARPDICSNSSLPVFIVGMPRSGTTLVEQIISRHSKVFGAGELGIIPQLIQGLDRWERHVGSGREYPDIVDDISPEQGVGLANEVLKELTEYAPEASYIVDKLPHNFENIGLIKFLFPRARIISVRRDPRDIAISNYFTDYQAKYDGMGFAYDLREIGEQLADHANLMDHWHRTFPGEILEINYEDVVDDLEGSARRLLAYLDLRWESKVLDFNKSKRSVKTASVWQVRQPIYKTSKEKWRCYEPWLKPLIEGTNAKIVTDPIKMISLPKPGWLTDGVDHFHNKDLDKAEFCFKSMLHHNPKHAACNYMLGLVYIERGYIDDGIELVEKAIELAPWQKPWQQDLAKAKTLKDGSHKPQKKSETAIAQPPTADTNGITIGLSSTIIEITDQDDLAN